jgi:acyl carrier protein
MSEILELKQRIKEVLIEELMLQEQPDEIGNDTPLFGDGLGLDSVDALQLVVALEKNFDLKISDAEKAKLILRSVDTIAEAVTDKFPGK